MRLLIVLMLFLNFGLSLELKEVNSYKEAMIKGKNEGKKVLMYVYADYYCPWCEKMQRETLKDPRAIEFINKDYIFLRTSRDGCPDEFDPRFFPTTYLIDPVSGDEEYALYGYKSTEDLIYELSDDEDDE